MLILKAFPLSFSILWRFALILPIVVVCLFWMMFITLLYVMFVALISAELLIIAVILLALASSSIIPLIIGMRLGLKAKGVLPRNSYFGLILPAIGYGIFEGLCWIFIFFAGAGVFVLISPMSLADALNVIGDRSVGMFAAMEVFVYEESLPALAVMSVTLFLIWAVRAVILAPIAGASIGQDFNGQPHTPFMGIASRFFPLFVLSTVSYIAAAYTTTWLLAIAEMLGKKSWLYTHASQTLAMFDGTAPFSIGWEEGVIIAMVVLFFLWTICLQSAGAVLAYLDLKAAHEVVVAEEEEETLHMKPEEVRALWKSRMPNGGA